VSYWVCRSVRLRSGSRIGEPSSPTCYRHPLAEEVAVVVQTRKGKITQWERERENRFHPAHDATRFASWLRRRLAQSHPRK
jgi:hypothetical protein